MAVDLGGRARVFCGHRGRSSVANLDFDHAAPAAPSEYAHWLSRQPLWAVFSMGKPSPGFRWAIPRHTSSGAGAGGMLYRAWRRHSDKLGRPVASVMPELRSGARLD